MRTGFSQISVLNTMIALSFACPAVLCVDTHPSKPNVLAKTKLAPSSSAPSQAIVNAYLQSVREHIDHFWTPAKGSNCRASIAFRVDKYGRAFWVELVDASPVVAVNRAAQDAVFYSSPLAPLPPSIADHIDFEADFTSDFQPIHQAGYLRPTDSNLIESLHLLATADASIKDGKLESAIEALQKARELTPFDVRVRDRLAEAYIQSCQSKPDDMATSLLHQALLLEPKNTAARAKLNQLISDSALDPQNFEVRVALARGYAKSLEYEDALCEYGEAWLIKNDPELINEISTACLRRRKSAEIRKWQAVLKISNTREAHVALAHSLEECGETDTALQEYRTAAAMQPTDVLSQAAVQRLEIKNSQSASEIIGKNEQATLSDDFPYVNYGSRSLTVKVLKDRKVTEDYLDAACPEMITRWATNRVPLRVYVENPIGLSGYRPQFRQFMIDAFATWVKASEGRLSYSVVDYPQQANIVCRWVSQPVKGLMHGKEQGVTRSKFLFPKKAPRNCMVQSADIFILTVYRSNQEPLSDVAIRAVCLHELGHALGISGHSPNHGDMMYPAFSPYDIPLSLTDRDVATIKRLYQGYLHPH